MSQSYRLRQQEGFKQGFTSITTIGEEHHDTGINFGILKLQAGESWTATSPNEAAYQLLNGDVTFEEGGQQYPASRTSLFEQDASVLHVGANKTVTITATTDAELAISETPNETPIETIFYTKDNMLQPSEHRGQGLLGDTSYRIVRTIFDIRNRPDAKLVLGEVVNFPGRWSSYPPHHHPQPEIYHYRFTQSNGYGHGEMGDDVFKIQQFDTLKILDEKDHAQCSAPGYGMFYIWVIRHLPGDPYTVPEFTQTHEWTMQDGANDKVWNPEKVAISS